MSVSVLVFIRKLECRYIQLYFLLQAPIHAASQSGDVELVSFLLERGVDVNSSANYGVSMFMYVHIIL